MAGVEAPWEAAMGAHWRAEGGREGEEGGTAWGGHGVALQEGGRLGVAAGLCASVHHCSLLLAERRKKETGRRKEEERRKENEGKEKNKRKKISKIF
jgi:hypothetical protein